VKLHEDIIEFVVSMCLLRYDQSEFQRKCKSTAIEQLVMKGTESKAVFWCTGASGLVPPNMSSIKTD
jgi:hypothetical protein